jgi:KRAB domain-containing zinc finger protein
LKLCRLATLFRTSRSRANVFRACHDEAKPYECLECGKKFSKASHLRSHRRRHFEVGAFECQVCQKRFYTPNKLKEHVRVHT